MAVAVAVEVVAEVVAKTVVVICAARRNTIATSSSFTWQSPLAAVFWKPLLRLRWCPRASPHSPLWLAILFFFAGHGQRLRETVAGRTEEVTYLATLGMSLNAL